MMKKMTITTKPARGTRGVIIRVLADDGGPTHVLRVYDEDHKFVDYDIVHYDLAVEIIDDAVFCDDGKRQWIDYEDY